MIDEEIDMIYDKYLFNYIAIVTDHTYCQRNYWYNLRKHHIGSMGKFPLMIILGNLIKKNIIQLDVDIGVFYDKFNGITIKDLIEHTSGLRAKVNIYLLQISEIDNLLDLDNSVKVTKDKTYKYDDINYIVLSIILNNMFDFKSLYKKLFKKLDIKLQFVGSQIFSSIGLFMTYDDVVKIIHLLFYQNKIIKKSWRKYCIGLIFYRISNILCYKQRNAIINYTIGYKQYVNDQYIFVLTINNIAYKSKIDEYLSDSMDKLLVLSNLIESN